MTSNLSRSLLLSSAAGLSLSLLSALPASAHGGADAGLIGGALHPLLGIDHLLLLVGVGLFEVVRREFAKQWGHAQEEIEREIKRRETAL